MPTGAGKTWLAEQAIDSMLRAGARAIYLTPLRALANELVERWTRRFEGHEVGVFTGEYGQRQAYPVPFDRARLLIMTPERLDACTRNWRSHWGWLPEVNLLVVDELHLLGERGRGPRLEGALMRARRLNPFLQLIGLSATLGNRAELAEWLGGVHYGSSWRPIPIEWRSVRFQRATDKPRILREEVQRCVSAGGQSLVFVQSRRRAEALSTELRDAGIAAGHHHAGLDSDERRRLEGECRAGELRALVSTGRLEMGLNLPARQVVLYDLQCFDGSDFVPLSVNTVWQRAGRAGRRGLDTQGEVVLIAPAWDRDADRYAGGHFEKITSGLGDERALAEQVLAEVSSGLARTRPQLARNLQQSLAAHQQRLPVLDRVVGEMVDSGMLVEVPDEGPRAATLKATRLGRIAVRQMLAPSTVVTLSRSFQSDEADGFTFLDILLLCAQTDDCDPRIPVDFEELEELGTWLAGEPSTLLSGSNQQIQERLGLTGRRLLAVIKTALVVRAWTRLGDAADVADNFGCYAFEVRRLGEGVERILTAAVAVLTPPRPQESDSSEALPETIPDDGPTLPDRVRALVAMVVHGVDEQVVTLTFLDGIGGTLARRLRDAGITDIEELPSTEPSDLSRVRGISAARAARWIAEATLRIKSRSAFSFREIGHTAGSMADSWNWTFDPYRFRRAMDLEVRRRADGFEVSGGLEPHRVLRSDTGLRCDCADFAKGHVCKHTLAVRLHCKDAELLPLAERLSSRVSADELDLFHLWYDGGKR
ncbi:MAG: DEAD/DEAH box helicase [Blastocatellia bacterium]|nr:DEAD/DEAH box helicase [Blastocatellia bacterium]